jgi:transglutaminase/protease-like cytokinesis protein 3
MNDIVVIQTAQGDIVLRLPANHPYREELKLALVNQLAKCDAYAQLLKEYCHDQETA